MDITTYYTFCLAILSYYHRGYEHFRVLSSMFSV
jgi:hypothetical protein